MSHWIEHKPEKLTRVHAQKTHRFHNMCIDLVLHLVLKRQWSCLILYTFSSCPIVTTFIHQFLILFSTSVQFLQIWSIFHHFCLFIGYFLCFFDLLNVLRPPFCTLLANLGRCGWGWLKSQKDYINMRPEAPGVWAN